MASPLDKPLRKVSLALVQKFGVPVTITLKGDPGDYDTRQGKATAGAPATVATNALVQPHKARTQATQGAGTQVGAAVRHREASWTVAAAAFESREPRTGDEGTLGGTVFRVLGANPIYSGEQVALYELHVKR